MKTFFSNVWVKCISSLLILAVVLGGMLAVLNPLLHVPAEERTARAIKKIYGEAKEFTVYLDVDDSTRTDKAIDCFDQSQTAIGTINKIYQIENDTLFQTTGYNGYKNGTITLWIKVSKTQGERLIIDKIVLETNTKQTLMSKLDGSYYQKFYVDVTDNLEFFSSKTDYNGEHKNVVSGATKSAMAGCNAVNCVLYYLGVK